MTYNVSSRTLNPTIPYRLKTDSVDFSSVTTNRPTTACVANKYAASRESGA